LLLPDTSNISGTTFQIRKYLRIPGAAVLKNLINSVFKASRSVFTEAICLSKINNENFTLPGLLKYLYKNNNLITN